MIKFEICKDNKKFDEFVTNHRYTHYQKTTSWGIYRVNCCHDKTYIPIVALQDEQIVASGLILITKRKVIGDVAYIPWGYCMDYNNHNLLKQFVEYTKQVVKKYHVTCIKIDFNIKRCLHDKVGHVIEGENNEALTTYLKQLGFKHKGYGYAYNGSWSNRYTLIAPISEPGYEKTIQKSLYSSSKRQLKNGVVVEDGCADDIPQFLEFQKQLAQKKSFTSEDVSYFEEILTYLKPYVHFKMGYIDYQARLNQFEKELNSKGIDKDIEHKQRLLKDIDELKKTIDSGKVKDSIGGAIYLVIGEWMYNWYLYTDKNMNQYIPAGVLHLSMLREAVELDVKHMDFVGFAGNCDPDDPYYGLYEFKSKWGSEFVEYIGEFDYVLNKPKYISNQLARKMKHYLRKIK